MFSTSLRGGKAFAAEQKIRELKTRIAKLNSQKLKISPKKIIEMSTANMNIQPSKKDGFSLEEVEKRALESKRFRALYNMHRLDKTQKVNQRQDRYNQKKYSRKRKKLRENLNIGEKVYVLAERSYFNKDTVFTIRKKQTIDDIRYYWSAKFRVNPFPHQIISGSIKVNMN